MQAAVRGQRRRLAFRQHGRTKLHCYRAFGGSAVRQPPHDDGPMSDVDLPKIGAPATRALASIGITRLDHVADRSQAELLALHGFGPRALRILNEALTARGQCVPERGSETGFPGALLGPFPGGCSSAAPVITGGRYAWGRRSSSQ